MLKASIIIPVHNSEQTIALCLEGLRELPRSSCEIIIVNDASIDQTISIAKKYDVKIIHNEIQKGASFSRNIGTKHAQSDLLIFIDSDIETSAATILATIDFMQTNLQFFAFTGPLTPEGSLHNNFFTNYKNYYMNYTFNCVKGEISFLYGGYCGFRKVLPEIYWPENIKYGEDTWLGNQLFQTGHKIALLNFPQIIHHKKYDFTKIILNDFRIPCGFSKTLLSRIKSRHKNSLTNFSHTNVLQLTAILLLGALTCLGAVDLLGHFRFDFYIYLLLFLLWFASNLRMFNYFTRKTPISFFIPAIFFTFLDQFVMGLGALTGIIYEAV
jgi:glycosyltransferase involved in cell wall biosynthesis